VPVVSPPPERPAIAGKLIFEMPDSGSDADAETVKEPLLVPLGL
jgi:hypothetical protein